MPSHDNHNNVQFQKIFMLPGLQKALAFPQGRASVRPKKLKEMYEAQLEFPEGWGSVGEVYM